MIEDNVKNKDYGITCKNDIYSTKLIILQLKPHFTIKPLYINPVINFKYVLYKRFQYL